MIDSHRTLLSYVLNEHYNLTFTMYLKTLRIRYITNLLLEDPKYLNYSTDGLTQICGMANRQVFGTFYGDQWYETYRLYKERKRRKDKRNLRFILARFYVTI